MTAPTRFAVKLPISTMCELLTARKSALEAEIRERFRAAREHAAPKPDVHTIGAILRQVKRQLLAVGGDG